MGRSEKDVGLGRRLGIALLASALGWLIASLVYALYGVGAQYMAARRHGYLQQWSALSNASGLLFWFACTAVFTLLVTLVFILPYVGLRSSASILRQPWRMYIEPAVIGVACITGFGLYYHPTAYTMWQSLLMQIPYLLVAILTSSLSSYFFLRLLRRVA